MPDKICLIHLASGPGGIEVLFPVMINNMPERSFNAFVIRKEDSETSVYENTAIPIKYGSNWNLVAYFKMFLYAVKNRKNIFHAFNIGPVFLMLLKLGGAKQIIYSIHGTIYWKSKFKKIFLQFFWQKALKGKIVLLANSEHSRNEFLNKINSQVNVGVLYNPMDTQRFSPVKISELNKEILVIYSGRLEKGKNLPKWIEIAAYLHAEMPNTRFELYGEGSLKSALQQQITSLNADNFIYLKGFRKDIENVYRKASLFLFLSEYESFGNVVAESILCGTPVIASPIQSMKEIFRDYPQFILNENEDLNKQVLAKLKQLAELRKLTMCARDSFVSRFSKEKHIHSLQHIYSTCEKQSA
jgi:glycosyltransferase involved in cell wall biosynthesis